MQKPAFPRLLKLLFGNAFVGKPENIMSGFRKCGLYPVNKEAVPKAKLLPLTTLIPSVKHPATVSSTSASESEQQMTPLKAMRLAIVATVCPPVSESTRPAVENAGRKRRRVQKRHGEVLTYDSSLQRLHKEEEERRRKKSTSARRSLAINDSICYMCMHEDPPLNDDISDSEDDEIEWGGWGRCDRWYHIKCVSNTSDPCVHCQ